MKLDFDLAIVLVIVLSVLDLNTFTCRAQGNLTPPGAPAPTMKSLDQIEPRTPVDAIHTPGNSSVKFVITQPGSYYLTTNIVGASGDQGIIIQANNVTLDLKGFSLLGNPDSFSAITVSSGYHNVIVRNGLFNGWSEGVTVSGNNVTLEQLTVSGSFLGLYCDDSAMNVTIKNCTVTDSSANGITIGNNSLVSGCLTASNASDGIFVSGSVGGNVISGNNCVGNDTSGGLNAGGIIVQSSNNRIEDNHVTGTASSGYGIAILSGTKNLVIKNSVTGSGTNNYFITNQNDAGPIGSAYTNGSPWLNISH
jgi:parallel beta-helix repeat protein